MTTKIIISFLLFPIFLLISCQKSDLQPIENENSYSVSFQEAKSIASNIVVNGVLLSNNKSATLIKKSVKNLKTILDDENQQTCHVINYNEGGFVVLSADKRAMPILAYSSNGSFPNIDTDIPFGLMDWIEYAKSYVKKTKKAKKQPTSSDLTMWNACVMQASVSYIANVISPIDSCGVTPCQDQYETVGPLLQTQWSQGCGYNNLMPYCNDPGYCNKAPTGCVATAMAQVMKYHNYPTNYNWANMPNSVTSSSSFGSTEISGLMYDIGVKVDMQYACDGSSADAQSAVPSGLINGFGYSSAQYIGYEGTSNYDVVKNELRSCRPVIFKGGENVGWWILKIYGNGHAWVSDGFSSAYYCQIGVSTLYLHMNWGWAGSYDGFYAFDNFNPDNHTFNYRSGVVVNIKP
ncbi:MAG: C10 family peptidase [Bacteroidota bacterium]